MLYQKVLMTLLSRCLLKAMCKGYHSGLCYSSGMIMGGECGGEVQLREGDDVMCALSQIA